MLIVLALVCQREQPALVVQPKWLGRRTIMASIRCATAFGFGGLVLVTSCGDDSRLNVQSPTATSIASAAEPAVSFATTGSASTSSECPVPPGDVAPQRGDCTLVDWDVLGVDGALVQLRYYVNEPGCSLELSRVEIDERSDEVSLRVVVGFTGDGDATCPTALGSRSTSVELSEPLGTRRLLGCRPVGSFAPKGGYDTPEPRDPSKDCRPQP